MQKNPYKKFRLNLKRQKKIILYIRSACFITCQRNPSTPQILYNCTTCWSSGVMLKLRLNIIEEHLNSKCNTGWSYRPTAHVTHSLLLKKQKSV